LTASLSHFLAAHELSGQQKQECNRSILRIEKKERGVTEMGKIQ
jgi:hypothetical protein